MKADVILSLSTKKNVSFPKCLRNNAGFYHGNLSRWHLQGVNCTLIGQSIKHVSIARFIWKMLNKLAGNFYGFENALGPLKLCKAGKIEETPIPSI